VLFNLAIIVILALLANLACEKIKIPGLLGMILVGILFGPYGIPGCNIISPMINEMSAELRTAALIIILIRAGLGLNRQTLNKVGIPALKMSCIPCLLEGGAVTLVAHYLLELAWAPSGMLGFIIAAVSPAVVVPQMLDIKAKGYGKENEVPTLILAGASVDDVFSGGRDRRNGKYCHAVHQCSAGNYHRNRDRFTGRLSARQIFCQVQYAGYEKNADFFSHRDSAA
jgi:solute carrier family 9B (sodium/hydrogen exchanger), member 1/2